MIKPGQLWVLNEDDIFAPMLPKSLLILKCLNSDLTFDLPLFSCISDTGMKVRHNNIVITSSYRLHEKQPS